MNDRQFFTRVLDSLAARVHATLGQDVTSFTAHVLARIDMGANQYGAHAYLDRDNLAEASDEYADGISYPLFELQKLRAAGQPIPREAARLLTDAMGHAAIAHLKVTQARQLLSPQGPAPTHAHSNPDRIPAQRGDHQ